MLLQSPAEAARFTLLSINDLSQSAGVNYNFQHSSHTSSSTTSTDSSTNNSFGESYNISAEYSILHPRLLRGDANISLISSQEQGNHTGEAGTSSVNNHVSYNIDGIILDRKPYPLSFNVASTTSIIRPPFGRAYTLDSNGQNISLLVQNKYLPTNLTLFRTASTTSGLENDIENTSQTAALSFSNIIGELSYTNLSLRLSSNQQNLLATGTTDKQSDKFFDLNNSLSWKGPRNLQRRLYTKYTYLKSDGTNELQMSSTASSLNWQLGKALDSQIMYNQSRNANSNISQDLKTITGSLTHRYLECLVTNVSGSFANGSYNDGSDTSTSFNADVNYTKILPQKNLLGLNYGYHYALQERNRKDINLTTVEPVKFEPNSPFPQYIDLHNQNITSSTITIYRDAGQTLPFTDFTVNLSSSSPLILIKSDPGVSTIYISYSYQQNPNITFSSSGSSIGGRLSLFDGRHILNASYNWSDAHIIAGTDSLATVGGNSHLKVGLISTLTPHLLTLKYSADKDVYQDIQNLEASWTHAMHQGSSSIDTRADDRYSWYTNNGADTVNFKGWNNTFLLSTTYSRPVVRNFRGRLTLGYFNMMTSGITSNRLSLECGMDGTYGRTTITLASSANWGFSSSSNSLNQTLTLNVRRSF